MREAPERQGTGAAAGLDRGLEGVCLGRLMAASRGGTPNVNHTASKGLPEKPWSDRFSLLSSKPTKGSSRGRCFGLVPFAYGYLSDW